jgi:hypothetical protein
MKLPIYDLIINQDENNDAEVSFVALVDSPAIKKDFLAFKEEFIDPNKGEQKDEFLNRCPLSSFHYVKFSVDTIKQIAIKFSKKGYQKNVNLMHEADMQVEGLTMFESFISDSKRGIKPMEAFKDLPDGTWFGSFYVENPKVWELIKKGEVKGFSVEGMFDYEAPLSEDEKQLAELREILNSF